VKIYTCLEAAAALGVDQTRVRVYTCREAAAALGVDQTRVRVLCRSGRLGRKHGRAWLISDSDLKRYRDAGPIPPGKKAGGK